MNMSKDDQVKFLISMADIKFRTTDEDSIMADAYEASGLDSSSYRASAERARLGGEALLNHAARVACGNGE